MLFLLTPRDPSEEVTRPDIDVEASIDFGFKVGIVAVGATAGLLAVLAAIVQVVAHWGY